MTVDEIKQILELMREHELAEFELQREGETLRLRKHSPQQWTGGLPQAPTVVFQQPAAAAPAQAPAAAGEASVLAPASEDVDLAIVKSPIVGTFYRSPEPGAPSFVEVGQRVRKDQVLCIIDAMKLMNEITSEYEGELTSVYVENGKPVQYGERLFAIKTA